MTLSLATTIAVVPTAPLLAAANDVFRGTSSRYVVPILAHTKVTLTRDGRLHLTTTDYEVFVTRSVDAKMSVADVDNELEMAVLTVALKQALSKLDQKGDVTLVDEEKHLVLTQGSRTVRLAKGPVEEFPEIPEYAEPAVHLDGRHLSYIAKTVSTMVGKDDMLPVLTGTRIALEDGWVTGQSTDRFRLAIADIHSGETRPVPGAENFEGLVPRFNVVGTMFGDDENVGIGVDKGCMSFVGTDTRLHIRLIDGSFPKVRSLIPADPTVRATFDGPAFLKAIKFAEIPLTRNEALTVEVKPTEVTLRGGNDDQEMTDTVPAEIVEGVVDEFVTGFNAAFLSDIVKLYGKSPVTMSSTSETKPSLFTSSNHPFLVTLLMPRRRVS